MRKKLILAIAVFALLGLSIAAFAYTRTTIGTAKAACCCCKGDSCPMKKKDAAGTVAVATDKDDCCCCKGDSCPMHKGEHSSMSGEKHEGMSSDSCPMMSGMKQDAASGDAKSCDCDCCKKDKEKKDASAV